MIFSKWFTTSKQTTDVDKKENQMTNEFNAIEHGKALAAKYVKEEEDKRLKELAAFAKLETMLNLSDNYTIMVVDNNMYIISNMTNNKIKVYYVSRDIVNLQSTVGYNVVNIADTTVKYGFSQDVNALCADIYTYLSGQA